MQQQFIFFDPNGPEPSAEARKIYLAPSNTKSPWFGFIGNTKAVNKAIRVEFNALGNADHNCSDLSLALIGRAGCGKTDFVRRHAKATGLPMAEFSPRAINLVHDIFVEVQRVCEEKGIPLVEQDREDYYVFPSMIIFIDEVHALRPNIVQGLLKATEPTDRMLVTERGVTIDVSNVHWIIATTDRGKLFDAFDTRFSKISLNLYTKDQISQIIQSSYKDWPKDACELVAHYCSRVPREALAFAEEMRLEHNMNPGDWVSIAKKIAEDNEIDPHGMTYVRLKILTALGQGPVASKRLPIIAGVKEEELEKFIMPWMLEPTEDQSSLVCVTQRGYTITQAGIDELDKRNIPHKGEAALNAA